MWDFKNKGFCTHRLKCQKSYPKFKNGTVFWLKIPATSELMVSRMILIIHDGNSEKFLESFGLGILLHLFDNLSKMMPLKVSNMA